MGKDSSLPGNLTGNYHVRAIRPAFQDAHRVLPSMRDRAILRRHSLELRFWPEKHPASESGTVLDLDWSWIQACKPLKIGELRVHERIGDCNNIRVIFFDPGIREPHPIPWVLAVMQEKSNNFSKANVSTFKLRRQLVLERFYKSV